MTDHRTDVEWLLAQGAWMHALARGLLGDRALAEDVVQDAYAAALARGPRAGGTRRAWLAAVVGNLARRTRGRAARRVGVEERAARDEAQGSAAELVERMELQRRLAEAVLALAEPYRSAVLWRHVEGLGAAEIAARQGCTPDAARQRVARGLEHLRRALDERFGQRSAWALALAPLAGRAPSALLSLTTALGGLLMGSKLITLAVAGVSAAALAFVVWPERGQRSSGGTAREAALAPAVNALAATAPELAAPAAASASERESVSSDPLPSAAHGFELSGFVHDVDGRPLARANLVLAAEEAEARALVERGLPDVRWATSDASGSFRLRVDADGTERWLCGVLAGYLPARVEASAGAPLDVLLHSRPVVEIVLNVAEDVPAAGPAEARLWVRREDGTVEELAAQATGEGRLVARELPLGRLERIRARWRGAGRVERALDLALVPDGYERIELLLPRGATVSGVVLDASTGTPIAGADVWAEEGWLAQENATPVTQADEHGRFTLVGVAPDETGDGRVWCMVSAEASGYVGQRFDMHSWPRSEAERYRAELRLVPASARIEGRVVFPEVGNVPARVWAVDGRAQFHFLVTNGHFTLSDLAPGALELFIATLEGAPAEARAALRATVVLAEGENKAVEFTLEPASCAVRGRLVDLQGVPVRGARMGLNLNMHTESLAFGVDHLETASDAEGRFEFHAAFPGRHHLQVLALPAGLCVEAFEDDIELVPGERTEVELRCAPPIELAGSVELAGRDPATLRVVAHKAHDGAELDSSVVAADGAFRFPRLYPTEIELRLFAGETELGRTKAGPHAQTDLELRGE